MEYRITSEKDIDILMDIRLKMLRQVNDLADDYVYPDDFVENIRNYFLNGDQTTCIALDDGKPVGCATMSYFTVMPTFDHPTGKRAHLMNVYTDREHRRQGIARKLIQMLIDDAEKRGVTEIALDATEMGRPLYAALGFRPSDEYMVMTLTK